MEAQVLTHPNPVVPQYLSYIIPIRVAARIQWDHTSRNAARAVKHCLSDSLILWHDLLVTVPWSRNHEQTPCCHQSMLKNARDALWLVKHLWSSVVLFWSCPQKFSDSRNWDDKTSIPQGGDVGAPTPKENIHTHQIAALLAENTRIHRALQR